MSNCCNDNPNTGCVDCTQTMTYLDTFCQEGCKEYPATDCVLFSHDSITGPISIENGETLTSIILKLVNADGETGYDITWNSSSRALCLTRNGTSVRCVTIADQDDQYLTLTSNRYLKIFKPSSDGDVQIGSTIDLIGIFTESTLTINSDSLVVTPGGTHGHTPTIELEPSSDEGNALVLGEDGKPYVPESEQGITDVVVEGDDYITLTKDITDGVLTITATLNIEALAEAICPLCSPTCVPPTNLVVTS